MTSPLTLHAVEEPAFSRSLGFLPAQHSASGDTLQLQQLTRVRESVEILPKGGHVPASQHTPPSRLQWVMSLTLLAGLLGFGYVAALRSVSAIQSAWHTTDTSKAQPPNTATTRYHFENAEIPGPYQSGSSIWTALREHLRLPSVLPSRKL